MLESAFGRNAWLQALGDAVYGVWNSLLVILLFIVWFSAPLMDPLLARGIETLFLAEAFLMALLPLLPGGYSRAPRWRNPLFLLLTLLPALGVLAWVMGIGPDWNPDPVSSCSVYAFVMAGVTLLRLSVRASARVHPALVLSASFLVVISLGTLLLLDPRATPQDTSISFTDAFFTSASATCVTGLVVVDTGTAFTFFGQAVILLLIQTGGLGIMTFAAFFALSLGRNLSMRDAFSLSRMMDVEFISDLRRLVVAIFVWTLAIEAVGAFFLLTAWRGLRPDLGPGGLIWHAVFHSISAFCNAGFSLNPESLEGYRASPATSVIMGTLIILGGLGFGVLTDIARGLHHRVRTGRKTRLSVQTRFTCLITFLLILAGFAVFMALEWNNTLTGMPLDAKVSNAFLQAVTPRTAGFNVVPTGSLVPTVKWLFIMLMFIGASPGGTGGGVKTTALGLMVLSVRSLATNRENPEIWKRRIPNFDLRRAGAMFTMGFTVFAVTSLALLITESASGNRFGPMDYIFETMSAFGTVGLSTGVTPALTTLGRWVVIITMFIGRTAPATLVAATFRKDRSVYHYPEARITVG